MKYPIIGLLAMMLCLVSSTSIAKPSPAPTGQANNHLVQAYGQLPLSFEANQGQIDKSVQFLSRGTGYTLFLTPTEAVLELSKVVKDIDIKSQNKGKKSAELRENSTVRMQLVGANASPKVAGVEELPGKVNYLNGNDPKQWRTNVATYGKVKYEQVYPGIDLVYYGNQRQLEYDFVVAPGADPAKIQLGFAGRLLKDNLVPRINSAGELVVGEVQLKKPVIYQEIGGQRKAVDGKFILKANKQIGFQVAAYDKAKSLVIDPVLVYSTYLGTGSQDDGTSIAVDDSGQVYVVGYTTDSTFPLVNPLQPVSKGQGDVFITKLSADGSSLVYSTYLGGSKFDKGTGIAIDSQGQAYVTGFTQSSNFPVANPLQPAFKGVQDIFIAKLGSDGASLVYSTYLGGSAYDESNGIAVDFDGQAYVTGFTQSTNFPMANALQATYGGSNDAFVTKLNTDGTGYIYSTYLGGDSEDIGFDVAVDSQGQAYVVGHAHSANFPVANALQVAKAGSNDVFISKLTADGTGFVYSTYLGGTDGDTSKSIAVDTEGQAYVTGSTMSSNFPLLNPFQAVHAVDTGGFDAFVTKINAEGTSLVYSTYLGGNKGEISTGIAVGLSGHAYVTGYTTSLNFPLVSPLQPAFGGGTEDIFITKLNPDGASLAYSTYLGGNSRELFPAIAVDSAGHAYVAGSTQSANFPLATPFQPVYGGGGDAFITKIVTDYALGVSATGVGTITSDPAGINCGENCQAPFIPNATVTLTATPAANNLFDGWEGDCTGTESCIVTMDEAKSVSARFINPSIPTTLTVAKSGDGIGTVTSDPAGINCGANCTADYPQNKLVTLTATPAANALFAGWDGACSITGTYTCTVTMDEAKTVTAAFNPGIPLTVVKAGDGGGTVTSDIPGIDCGEDCTEAYDPGAQVTLTAEPDNTSVFTGWTGACTGTDPCTVTLDTEKTVTATFKKTGTYLLTVAKGGDGAGAVSSTPTGIDCGVDCTESYANKTVVALTATPEAGSTFTGWSTGCSGIAACSVTMTADKTVTATFKKIPTYVLTVSKNVGGSVISNPTGIDCGAVCSKSYNEKTVVALTATPDVGFSFDSWSGGCTGKAACSVTMTKAQTVTAKFVKAHTIALNVTFTEGSGKGSITSTGISCNNDGGDCTEGYLDGQAVTFTAAPDKDSRFVGWVGDIGLLCPSASQPTCKITFTENMAATFTGGAVFGPKLSLNVFKDGNGTGKVTGTPGGIDCGPTCTAKYLNGDKVTLTAKPDADSTFTKWQGRPSAGTCSSGTTTTCTVALTDSESVYATFTKKSYDLSVTKGGDGAGSVASSPEGITCGADCSETYLDKAVITLTATAEAGSTFDGWSGDCKGATLTCTVTMSKALKATATFKKIPFYTLTLTVAGDGRGSVLSSPFPDNPGGAGDIIFCSTELSVCSKSFVNKTAIAFTTPPMPEPGSIFAGWSGACTGTDTCGLTMTANTKLTATFKKIPSYLLTVVKSGNGTGTVGGTGITCGTDCTESLMDKLVIGLSAIADADSMFTGWSGGGCTGIGICSVTMTKAQTVTAKFVKKHNIALKVTFTEGSGAGSITGTGIDCNNSGGDCTEDYPDGAVTLTATPDKDSRFVGWVGDMASLCQGQGANKKPVCKITFNANMAASFTGGAVFGPKLVLNVFKDGTGSGKVTSTPAAIDCGASCTAKYLEGATITLTAKPDADSTFTKWTSLNGVGTCFNAVKPTCKVTMNDSVIPVYATFTKKPVTLTVVKSGTGASSGTVSSSPAGIACGKDCSEPYVVNTSVTLTATVTSPATFTGWSGGGCSGTSTCTVTMSAATKVTAAFKK